MTEFADDSSQETPKQSYRTCTACGCAVHQSRECCPECGAFPGELHAPSAHAGINFTMTLLLALILGASLFALTRNREEAATAEAEKFSRLNQSGQNNSGTAPVALPSPTPAPRPTTAPPPSKPTPKPTPKQNPFKPTATPKAQPMPTRKPAPTPVPVPTRPSTLDLKDQLAASYKKELDEKLPMAQVGEETRLVLRDNRSISGRIQKLDPNQLALQTPNGLRWIPYRQLAKESRMRVDKSERDTWVEEKALEEVLKRLQN